MARTKVTATSTSTVSGKASGRGGRAARATTRKKISYAEQDEDEDEEMDDGEGEGEGEGDTTLVDEEEEEGDDEVPESTFDLAELVKVGAFSKSRSKKEKTETAKLEKQLEEMLQSANNEVESLTVDAQKKTDATIAPLHLDDARPVSRIEPKGYRSAFTEQHNLTKQLVDALDGYKEELDPANDEFFEAAKQARMSN
ncbi:hypothetical protein JCM11641_003801 [Rhodosporidiobolus odoratus]